MSVKTKSVVEIRDELALAEYDEWENQESYKKGFDAGHVVCQASLDQTNKQIMIALEALNSISNYRRAGALTNQSQKTMAEDAIEEINKLIRS